MLVSQNYATLQHLSNLSQTLGPDQYQPLIMSLNELESLILNQQAVTLQTLGDLKDASDAV